MGDILKLFVLLTPYIIVPLEIILFSTATFVLVIVGIIKATSHRKNTKTNAMDKAPKVEPVPMPAPQKQVPVNIPGPVEKDKVLNIPIKNSTHVQMNGTRNHKESHIFLPVQLVFPPVLKNTMFTEYEMELYDILLQIIYGELVEYGVQFLLWPKIPLCNLIKFKSAFPDSVPGFVLDALGSCATFVVSWKETFEPVIVFLYIDETTSINEEIAVKAFELLKRANITPIILREKDVLSYKEKYLMFQMNIQNILTQFVASKSVYYSQEMEYAGKK